MDGGTSDMNGVFACFLGNKAVVYQTLGCCSNGIIQINQGNVTEQKFSGMSHFFVSPGYFIDY